MTHKVQSTRHSSEESTFCFVVYFLKNDEDTILYLKNTHTHIYFNMITKAAKLKRYQ